MIKQNEQNKTKLQLVLLAVKELERSPRVSALRPPYQGSSGLHTVAGCTENIAQNHLLTILNWGFVPPAMILLTSEF